MTYVIYQNHNFRSQIDYTFGVMFSVYGIEYLFISYEHLADFDVKPSDLVISYGKKKPYVLLGKHVHIYESDFFGNNYLQPESLPVLPLKRFNEIPVIYYGHVGFDDFVRRSEGSIESKIDIIASSFFMLTRYEEVIVDVADELERFPVRASLACKEGFLDQPVVNEYMELLWSWMHSLQPQLYRSHFWPDNKALAVCLTHDVDVLRLYRFSYLAGIALRRLKLLLIPKSGMATSQLKENLAFVPAQNMLRVALIMAYEFGRVLFKLKRDPCDTFDYILGLEEVYGFSSSFYFMACIAGTYDLRYILNNHQTIKTIRKIERNGCEVGLHGSYDSYKDIRKMAEEKGRLDKVVLNSNYGCRQHYLRWKTPETWRIQSKLGLLYDTTLGFADRVGFRCGFCFPYKPFDVRENRVLDIWELPLIVMEASFAYPDYRKLSSEAGYSELIRYIDIVKKYHGNFVLLWHNSSFDSRGKWMRKKETYDKLMKHISGQCAFVASGREIIEWWEKRVLKKA